MHRTSQACGGAAGGGRVAHARRAGRGALPPDATGRRAMAVVCRYSVWVVLVSLLCSLKGSTAQRQVPHPVVCAGNPALCLQMQEACPASYRAGSLIIPDPNSQISNPACSLPPGGATTSAGDGKCHDGWMCDISNVTGSVKKRDFSDACVQCPAGACCVTMNAENLTRGLENIVADINPAAAHLPSHEDKPRIVGAVLVYRKPCPRNYQCPVGMIDDAHMVGKGTAAGEQCVSQKCMVYEGCPEGTDVPDTGNQKIFALVASLVWYAAVVQLRFCHRKTRDKRLKKTRSSANLQLDTSQSYSDLHASLNPGTSGHTTSVVGSREGNQPSAGLWSQLQANWQESGLRETGVISRFAFEPTNDQVSRPSLFLRLLLQHRGHSGPCSQYILVLLCLGRSGRRAQRFAWQRVAWSLFLDQRRGRFWQPDGEQPRSQSSGASHGRREGEGPRP